MLLSLLPLPLLLLLPGMLPPEVKPEVKPEAGRAAPRIRGCGISTLRQWPRPEHPRIQGC